MIYFVISLFGLIIITILYQLITKMKIVGGNQLGVVSGKGEKGFRFLSGGRAFIIPLLNKFDFLDLTPYTIEVKVESAIASGVIPLNVKATVSFAIASNDSGRRRALTRILTMAKDWDRLRKVASDIIEGHLRDSIASITPEQVMKDKDTLVAKMINVCKNDLENIGLEITTMNIADVDDHRLEGVKEPDLYIALLKRVQTTNAETKARKAQAEAEAAAAEEEEQRRAEVQVRSIDNEYEQLLVQTRLRVKEEDQLKIVGIQNARQNAQAQVSGLVQNISAEKERIEMLKKQYEAEIITPALAAKEKSILQAKAKAARYRATAQAEIDEMKKTLEIIKAGGKDGQETYLIENFERIIKPFSETMAYFPVKKIAVISGAEGRHEPISAVHPHAVDQEKNALLAAAFQSALEAEPKVQQRTSAVSGSDEKAPPQADGLAAAPESAARYAAGNSDQE